MERLDDFLVELAIRNLPLRDLLACSATCKRFNSIITSSTKIQLFLHHHLFGRSSPPTTDRLENPPKAIKDRSTTDQLARLLRTEDNLLKFKPHLRSYELPANQSICTIDHGYIVTSCPSGAENEPDADGLYTLVTIWTPDVQSKEGKLSSKAVKVDFKPNTESKTRAVDVMDDVIICVQELDAGGDTVFRVRVLHLFNEGEIAKPYESDEITRTTQDMGLDNAPRVMIGREGLLVVVTPFSIKWTRWTEGKDCTWGHIQNPPYIGFSSSIRVYGSDLVGILGQCVPPLSDNPFAPPPIPKDHLLIYQLDDNAREVIAKPNLIMRMPYGRNELPEIVRYGTAHGEPENILSPGSLAHSNNGRSLVLQVNMILFEDPIYGHFTPHGYPHWITIDLPLICIKELLSVISDIVPDSKRIVRWYRTRRANPPEWTLPHVRLNRGEGKPCDCCIPANEASEPLGDQSVIAPHLWKENALFGYDTGFKELNSCPRNFGSRSVTYLRTYRGSTKTNGAWLIELECMDFRPEPQYAPFPKTRYTLGGLGRTLKLPKGPKDTGRIRPSQISASPSVKEDVPSYTVYRGYWKILPAKGELKNMLFDGEKIAFEYLNGSVTVLDFA
ncbi:hypothetical protein I203_105027 [Kwoniella mangroviensis CBS 8507]|uniref:uncharacterized protein n=1 Tax=Kwoniella mangroviensis CBS 8507 TaxID=1296122 RepID=UPI00080D2082|nr:uncharacterized protein I203_00027 [Kwoniella mangroviensis CBS 8507]OCF69900.1 hypothetical protein I203_00027 [Kwoniella mangroviensis CBS 8507]